MRNQTEKKNKHRLPTFKNILVITTEKTNLLSYIDQGWPNRGSRHRLLWLASYRNIFTKKIFLI